MGSPKLGKGLISVVGEDVRIAIECVGVLSWSCNLISIKGLVSRVKTIRMLGSCRMFLSILRGWYAAELVFSACTYESVMAATNLQVGHAQLWQIGDFATLANQSISPCCPEAVRLK